MLNRLGLYFPILLLTFGHGAVDLYIGLLQVVAPGLSEYLKIPLGEVILLVGLGSLLNNTVQPVAGYLMGRRNLAWVLWVAVPLSALPVFMGYAGSYWPLAALILLGAVGTGLYHPEGALASHDASGEKAWLGVPLFMAGGAAITAVGTPLSIKISEQYGFPALAWLCVPGLLIGLLFLLQYRHRRKTHPSIVLRPRSRRVTRAQEGVLSYWPLLAVAICFGVGNGMFISLLASHYELIFGPESRMWSGWVLMVMGIVGSLSSFLWSAIAHKRGFYKIALLTQIVACPLFVLMAWPSSPEMGLLIAIPLSVVNPNSVYPVAVTMARNASGLTQGLRTSIMMGGTSGVASFAIMAAGALVARGMSSSYLVLFMAFCSLLAVVLSAWQLAVAKRPAKRQ